MAVPGGKRAGRVSVRVIPDATKFRNDLKLLLKRVEQSFSANLEVRADTTRVESDLRRFQKKWNGEKLTLDAAVASLGATAHLKALTRPRTVPLIVKVSKASVLKAATIIASLSGVRVAGDLVKNLSERLQNLDRALPKIAAVSLGVANLASVLLSSVAGVFTLGAGLASIVGVTAALPGILVGMGVGGTVLALALADTKNQLADLVPDFKDLRQVVVDNFWGVAADPIRSFIGSVLPRLRVGLATTAVSVGNWASSVVASFQAALGDGVIDGLFANLVRSIDIASTGTGGFAQALVTLGAVGGSYLPRLAQYAADLSNRFAAFIAQVEADGTLRRFIDDGIIAVGQLSDALSSMGSIFSGIFHAAESAGGGGLATFASTLATIATIVNSPEFQTTLSTILTGAAAGAAGLATALGPIGGLLSTLAPTLSDILRLSGEVVGNFVGHLADALSQPAVQKGLADFFAGIESGLLAIGPSLPAIAAAFGTLLSFAGKLGAQLGPVLGATLAALAPVLVDILSALEPILPILGEALVKAITDLAPGLLSLVTAVLPLLPSLIDFLVAALPLVVDIVNGLVGFAPQLTALAVGIGALISFQTELFALFGGIIDFFVNGGGSAADFVDMLMSIPGPLRDLAKSAVDFGITVVNGLIDAINGIKNALAGVVNVIASTLGLGVSINVPNLPHLKLPTVDSHAFMATGGDILHSPGGTRLIAGEGGQDERVINRGLGNRALELSNKLAMRALAAGSGDMREGDFIVQGGEMAPEAIGRVAYEQYVFEKRRRR